MKTLLIIIAAIVAGGVLLLKPLVVGISLGIVILGALFTLLAIYFLASIQRIFTFVPRGQIMVVMVYGTPYKYLGNLKDRWVDPEDGKIYGIERNPNRSLKALIDLEKISKKNSYGEPVPSDVFLELRKRLESENPVSKFLEGQFGIYFMHWNPGAKIFRYRFSWNKLEQKEGSAEFDFLPITNVEVDSLFANSIYGVQTVVKTGSSAPKEKTPAVATGGKTKKAERGDAEQIPVKIFLGVNVEIVHAGKALFQIPTNPRWLGPTTVAVQGGVRDTVGQMTLDELTVSEEEGRDAKFFEISKEINLNRRGGNPSMVKYVGVKITGINFIRSEIVGTAEKALGDAATAIYVAQRTAQAKIQSAKGEAKATTTIATANAFKFDKEGTAKAEAEKKLFAARTANDPTGQQAAAIAIERTGVQTLILGSGQNVTTMIPLGGSKPPAGSTLGGSTPGGSTP